MKGTKLKNKNEKANTLTKHSHELQRQKIFHNQKYKILQKNIVLHIILFERIFQIKNN
jgi:hypothetical protein